MSQIIRIRELVHKYERYGEDGRAAGENTAIDGVTAGIEEGSFVAVLGHNGSGKSTLARHLDSLLLPTEGTVYIESYDTKDESHLWDVRQTAGMVFQNPDNQIIANVVEEDVAFGPENLGVPTKEIWRRVEESLNKTGMAAYRHRSPNRLSGGQKQRVAIAGVMAMKPKVIVLDEPTAMLDPMGRKEVIRTIHDLNRQEHITVVLITHYMEEVVDADELKRYRLDVPQVTELAWELKKEGVPLPDGILTIDEFADALCAAADKIG